MDLLVATPHSSGSEPRSPGQSNGTPRTAALEGYGRLDILILNAGAQAMNPVASYPEEGWDRLMDLVAKLSASTTLLSL